MKITYSKVCQLATAAPWQWPRGPYINLFLTQAYCSQDSFTTSSASYTGTPLVQNSCCCKENQNVTFVVSRERVNFLVVPYTAQHFPYSLCERSGPGQRSRRKWQVWREREEGLCVPIHCLWSGLRSWGTMQKLENWKATIVTPRCRHWKLSYIVAFYIDYPLPNY